MQGLVDMFADVGASDVPSVRSVPVSAEGNSSRDLLVALLEEEIYFTDVFGVVPLRFHLAEVDEGGVAGTMDVVDAGRVELIGPVPKAVSYHDLEIEQREGEWRCRVVIDV
jgi:protein archease